MPTVRIGQIKTFGIGPMYEVMGNVQLSENGEWVVPIRVVESGEQLDYRYSHFALDPKAV